jgi:hypothetical protein
MHFETVCLSYLIIYGKNILQERDIKKCHADFTISVCPHGFKEEHPL